MPSKITNFENYRKRDEYDTYDPDDRYESDDRYDDVQDYYDREYDHQEQLYLVLFRL